MDGLVFTCHIGALSQTTFQVSHRGQGFNELRFENAKGSEEVFIHAQRDMKT
ncbi:bacteriophage T4 gp5 trimerisation domain-containing protein [Photorhabdus tasmaniensis]